MSNSCYLEVYIEFENKPVGLTTELGFTEKFKKFIELTTSKEYDLWINKFSYIDQMNAITFTIDSTKLEHLRWCTNQLVSFLRQFHESIIEFNTIGYEMLDELCFNEEDLEL